MLCTKTEKIYLGTTKIISPVKTFECGQCFRWNADENGKYTGVAFGKAASVVTEDGKVYIICNPEDFEAVWRPYFDMDTDYEAIRRGFDAGEYMKVCAEFGAGIRILNQDKWEALCSFIISQCNNIARIKGIVDRLCAEFGQPLEFEDKKLYTFPSAETVAALQISDIAMLRCGYRAPYIIGAARAVASGELDLDALADMSCEDCISSLLKLSGVGKKVANCVTLFGLRHMDAFPIDVWMKRALEEHFPKNFDPAVLGPYAGLAQQYIFYYTRSGGRG